MEEVKTPGDSVGGVEPIPGPKPGTDIPKPIHEEKESWLVKYLKKIGMGILGFFVISPGATIQAFTYFFRGIADALVGLKRKGISELPKAVGKFFFYLFTKPFVFLPYLFSSTIDWIRIVRATGERDEKGEKAKITTVCKYKAYNFSDANNKPKAEDKELSASNVLKIAVGIETTATKECPKVPDGTGKENESVVNKAYRLYRETIGMNLDKDGSIKPKTFDDSIILLGDSSPFIL